jgi:hypothetical protein
METWLDEHAWDGRAFWARVTTVARAQDAQLAELRALVGDLVAALEMATEHVQGQKCYGNCETIKEAKNVLARARQEGT